MDCCHCQGADSVFNKKNAARELREYRKNGPAKTTRALVDALSSEGVDGLTLLDIGGGVGAIQHELLKLGVRSATNFEASRANIEACKEEADLLGHADAITHLHGDFATSDTPFPPADIVTLERVICCYPDMHSLVSRSCTNTRKWLGLVYPRETWWAKLGVHIVLNVVFRLMRNPFRVFVHPTKEVEAVVGSFGMQRRFFQRVGFWQVVVYGKSS